MSTARITREEILEGLPAKRASTLVFLIEGRTAHLLAQYRQAMEIFLTEEAAKEREMAFLEAFSLARQAPLRPTIRDLERYNENVIQNMNSAVLVFDTEGRVSSCNAAAGQILGQPVEALIGKQVLDWFPDGSGEGIVARTLAEGVRFKGAESA